jgi:hypothetical protein
MAAAEFSDVYDYADAYKSMTFEGIPVPGIDTFDENTYLEMKIVQKLKLDIMFTVDARKLLCSRMLRKPLNHMKAKVQCQIGGECETEDDLKYMIYSSHDD